MPELKLASSAYLDIQADSKKTLHTTLGADIFFPTNNHLFFSGGRTKVPQTDTQPDDLDTREASVGYGLDPTQEWSGSGRVDYWGQPNQLTTLAFEVEPKYSGEDWIFSFGPGLRFINVFISDTAPAELR